MRIDSTHRAWLAVTLVSLGAATAVYVIYATRSASGPSGGSPIGLAFGIIGSACMVFAGLLGARKKVPVWRLGRAQTWMRGHLWLGLLSLPLICFHAGFRFGGLLTTVLMILLIVAVVSGIFGAALQHYMPSIVTERVPMETIFEEIGNIRAQLIAEADEMVDAMCGPASLELAAVAKIMPVGAATVPDASGGTLPLRKFYSGELRPFLQNENKASTSLADETKATAMFDGLRTLLPGNLHETIDNLEQIGNIRAQLIAEADEMVDAICRPASLELAAVAKIMPVGAATVPDASGGTLPLRKFYSGELRPFLRNENKVPAPLADETKATSMFDGLRTLLPGNLHETIDNLEQICEEERQLRRQVKFHHLLHGWLMLHVPLSLALLLLGCAHAIMALHY